MKIIEIPLQKPQSYRGRNGDGTAKSIQIQTIQIGAETIVDISPFNSRGASGACIIQIDIADVPAVVQALNKLIQ